MHLNDIETAKGRLTLLDVDGGDPRYAGAPMPEQFSSAIKPTANIDGYFTTVVCESIAAQPFRLGEETECVMTFLEGPFSLTKTKQYQLHNGRRRVGSFELDEFLTTFG